MKLTHDAIVEGLAAFGMRHRTVQCETEGEYLPSDVDWNNKDVPHLNHLHSKVNDVTCVVQRDLQASVSLQKVLGIIFPLVLVHYDHDRSHHTHMVTALAWTMVTDHEFIAVTPTRTRAVTTYTVVATRFWMLFFPIIRALIKRNYKLLMAEDVPLRERRGQLRSWGYGFRGDEGETRDIRASLAIGKNNVLLPATPAVPAELPVIPIARIGGDEWTLVGRSDHLGLKLKREGRQIVAFTRMCPHEGADVDLTPISDGCLICPWHGRKLLPVAKLDLDDAEPRAETDWHRLVVKDDALHISITNTGPSASASTGRSVTAVTSTVSTEP